MAVDSAKHKGDMMDKLFSVSMAIAAITAICNMARADVDPESTDSVGRYQIMAVPDGRIFIIDTATGQCWSKVEGGKWHDEGNPTRDKAATAAVSRVGNSPSRSSHSQPFDAPIELTIPQHVSQVIPGSEGRLIIRLGDVAKEEVSLSIITTAGKRVNGSTTLAEGEELAFDANDTLYIIKIQSLDNGTDGHGSATLAIVRQPMRIVREHYRKGEPLLADDAFSEPSSPEASSDKRNAHRGENPPETKTGSAGDDGDSGIRWHDEPIALSIPQRHSKVIPGTDVIIRLGDISGGKVRFSVVTTDGQPVVGMRYKEEGDQFNFVANETTYVVKIRSLDNALVGEDRATLAIARIPMRVVRERWSDGKWPFPENLFPEDSSDKQHSRNEENPPENKADSESNGQGPSGVHLELPTPRVEWTMSEGQTEPIPGSGGTVQIRIGRIARGQVILSVVTAGGERLVDAAFLNDGEWATFNIQGVPYIVGIHEIDETSAGEARATVGVMPNILRPGVGVFREMIREMWHERSAEQGESSDVDNKSERITVKAGESFETNVSGTVKVLRIRPSKVTEEMQVVVKTEGHDWVSTWSEGSKLHLSWREKVTVIAINRDEQSVEFELTYPAKLPVPF